MNRSIFLIFYFTTGFGVLFGQSPFTSRVDSLILAGIDCTLNSEFDSADSNFQKVVDQYPDHGVGYFYRAATLQSKMMDYETNLWEEPFYRLIDQAIAIGEDRIENGDCDPWTSFYLGSSYSYKGLYQAKTGGIIKGFMSARKGIGYLKMTMKQDSTLYDACLGLGSYMYWAGKYYKYLRWLPWICDERKEGLALVKEAVAKSTFSHWVGVNSLGWIEYDRKAYDSALEFFQTGLEQYPGSRFFLWGVGSVTLALKQYEKTADVYRALLKSVQEGEINNGYNEAECHLKLSIVYYELGDFQKSLVHSEALLDLNVDETISERLREHMDQARTCRKHCLEKLQNQ